MTSPPRKLGRGRRAGILALVVVIALLGSALGVWLAHRMGGAPRTAPPPAGLMAVAHAMALFVTGVAAIGLGLGAYFVVLHTVCFTSDFHRPVFRGLKGKLYVANIVVQLLFTIGVGALLSMLLSPLLVHLAVPRAVVLMGPLLVGVVGVQLVLIWLQIWAPLERRLIEERLAALGVTPDRIATGLPVGVSDPGRSSLKKLTLVEDDVGMLWLDDDALRYVGDEQRLELPAAGVRGVEQKADAGSAAALGGVVNPVLSYEVDGNVRQVRFHPEGHWTLSAAARACDELAAALSGWRGESGG